MSTNLPEQQAQERPNLINKEERESTQVGIVRTVDDAVIIAKSFAASGMFKDLRNAGQAVAKIMYGKELGFGPAASMRIHFIGETLTLPYQMVGAMIKRTKKYNFKIVEHTNEKCSLEFFEWGESQGIETFDMTDAKRQDTGKANNNIGRYPKNFLYARALTNGARFYCAEVLNGIAVYDPSEIQDAEFEDRSNEHKGTADKVRASLKAQQAPQLGERTEPLPDAEVPYEPDPEFNLEAGE